MPHPVHNNLTRLALGSDDEWSRRSTVPPSLEWRTSDGETHLDEAETDRVRNMIEECGFTQTVLMPNFDARIDTVHPPTGYAATWHADSLFVADALDHNVFRCVQGVSLALKKRHLSVKPHSAAALNALFGDASPVPCVSRTQKDNWVCSLGGNAWIGLYDQHVDSKPPYLAVVVSGLDPASWNAMRKEMREEWHRKLTMREVYPRLEFWRNVSRQNGERALATFVRVMGETTDDTARMSELSMVSPYESRHTAIAPTDAALAWFGNPKLKIPKWFVFPSVAPRGCDPLPAEPGTGIRTEHERTESGPWTVVPEFCIMLDDIVPYTENEYVRLAGCCDARKPYRVIVKGPMDEILLVPSASSSACLHAVAAQATQYVVSTEIGGGAEEEEVDEVIMTWEDARVVHNRMVNATYTFRSPVPSVGAGRMMPHFVRVSCRDALGRAEVSRNRLASLTMDDWEPIRR